VCVCGESKYGPYDQTTRELRSVNTRESDIFSVSSGARLSFPKASCAGFGIGFCDHHGTIEPSLTPAINCLPADTCVFDNGLKAADISVCPVGAGFSDSCVGYPPSRSRPTTNHTHTHTHTCTHDLPSHTARLGMCSAERRYTLWGSDETSKTVT